MAEIKLRDKFEVSYGNIAVLQAIPEMMQDEEFRCELRRLTLQFKLKKRNK